MCENETMLEKAKCMVLDYCNQHLDVTNGVELTREQVYVVWFCKTLQNWKAFVSTELPDGMYYEITYDGDEQETRLDAYKKWDNTCIPDNVELTLDQVQDLVWLCKTLQNWKAIFVSELPERVYYEFTHNGNKQETHMDTYKKWDSVYMPDEWF